MNIEALFLGPKAENQEFFKEMLMTLIDDHVRWRQEYHPDDLMSITPADKSRADFSETQARIREVLVELSSKLKMS